MRWSSPYNFSPTTWKSCTNIDVAAREQAEESGIELRRIQTPCVMPELIQALAEVVRSELTQMPTG